VARYETGGATPSLATLQRLLVACGSALVLETATPAPRARQRRRSGRLALLRRSRDRLLEAARRHGVHDIRVFGSVARGDEGAQSDVDLLVDLEPGRTLIDLLGFQQAVEDILGIRVDVVAPRFMKERVRARALREARRV
jgi:predicted nucleotidyltransferase